jgi:ketosteroid isomerase-like protein
MALEPEARKQLETWLETWAECVRRVDPERARALFAPTLRAFGTRVFCADGLESVEQRQWRYVWPRTRGFAFEIESLEGWISDDCSQGCVAVPWRSTGVDAGGAEFERRGRATIVLARAGGTWRALHTHFSIDPAAPHRPLGAARD